MLSTVIFIAFHILCFINLSSSSHDSYLSSLSIPRDAILFNTTSSSPTEEQTKGSLLPFKREKGGSYSASLKKSLSRDPRRLVRQRIRNRFRKYKSKVVSHVKDIIHLQTPASLVASEASLNTSYLLERSISPLLVFVNRKSGGQRGNIVLQKFQSLFNHSAGVQICDLSNTKPKDFMHMYNGFPSDHLKILCCGGDGTAQWIMNEMYDAKLLNCSFSILPLGTGNDLYLALYGNQTYLPSALQTLSERPETYLSTYLSNRTLPLDRWGVQFNNIRNTVQLLPESNITSHPRKSIIGKVWKLATREGRRKKAGVLRAMNNYFGIGVDGAISMRFHEARNSMPYFFFSSIVNKFWYACVSLSTILSGKRLDLNSYIEIKCDGKRVQIPSNLQGIVLLNINSYAGGAKLWLPRNLTQWQPLNMSDGIVEVVGVLGVSHLAQIKAGLASGLELAQGRRIQILTKEYIPMQIDGEPWLQRPCRINIRRLHRVNMCVPEESALKSLLRSSTEAEEDLELENDLNYVLYDNSS